MRACVFVDGENFRYNIVKLFSGDNFKNKDYLPPNARWGEFFDEIVRRSSDGAAVRLRTYWYAIAAVDAWPYVPTEWSEQANPHKLAEWCAKYKNEIRTAEVELRNMECADIAAELRRRKKNIEDRFSGFKNLHRKIAARHRAVEFKYSGAISYDLFQRKLGREKTVDVNLAVDMLQMRDTYDLAVIVSGDQDYLPAVQAVKNAGKTVVNVAFSARSGELLPGGAKRLNESTDWSLTVDYKTLAEYMNLAKEAV